MFSTRFSIVAKFAIWSLLFLIPLAKGRPASLIDDLHVPHGFVERDGSNSSLHSLTSYLQHRQAKATSPEWLRIMPLGASIVLGLKSTPEDGFRKPLRDHLRSLGYKVNMVGSQSNKDGSMRDGNHEGHSGDRIDQIISNIDLSSDTKPNINLINAGTNDCQQNYLNMKGAIDRLRDLILKAMDKSPQAAVIVSTLLLSNYEHRAPGANQRVTDFNHQIRSLVTFMNGTGAPIGLADMNDGFITKEDLNEDGIHPNNHGYRKMAAVWNAAIAKIRAAGFLRDPENTGVPDDAPDDHCEKVPGKADGPHLTQKGYGFDDGPYRHKGTKVDHSLYPIVQNRGLEKHIAFAQLMNAGGNPDPKGALDDQITWFQYQDGLHVLVAVNGGNGDFALAGYGNNPSPLSVRRCDFLDDCICVESNGDLQVAINKGSSGNKINFSSVRFDVPDHPDYCLIGDNGYTRCWRNGGLGDSPAYWQDMGVVFPPKGKGDIRGTRFVDINGDGRSDWIWVGDKGDTDIFTNMRGPASQSGEKTGLVPNWIHAEASHGGMGVERVRDQIHFARIFAKDGSGRRDYVWIELAPLEGDTTNGDTQFVFHVWRNDGSGSTQRKSDWDRYGDLSGDGKDDYIQIRPDGDVEVWGNIGQYGEWNQRGVVHNIGRVDPKFIHIGDYDGDGKADILKVERGNGALTVIPL